MNAKEIQRLWLSASELKNLELDTLPKSKSSILSRAKKENWKWKQRKGRGGGWVFFFSSLPKEVQEEIKNNPQKWEIVCKLAGKQEKKGNWIDNFQKHFEEPISPFSFEDKEIFSEIARRLIVEEFRLKIDREVLANSLDISVEELKQYEHGEKPLNVAHLRKIKKLGFDISFLLFDEENAKC